MNYCELLYYTQCSISCVNQNVLRSNCYTELVYFKRCGGGTLYFDGDSQVLGQDDIVILPSGVKFRFECTGKNECVFVGFNGCDYDFKEKPIIFKDSNRYSVSWLLELMHDEFEKCRYERSHMLNVLLNAVILAVIRYSKPFEDKKDVETDNFNYIMNFMNAHSQNVTDINEFVKLSGLSYHRFRHKFKEITDISPQQYIIKQRLNFAKRMLETTSYSTSAVALACGFRSVSQFITCFNRQEGLTPVKYRKHFRENKE